MTTPSPNEIAVTQADRDAAADWLADEFGPMQPFVSNVRRGQQYETLIEAFARHRIASTRTPMDGEEVGASPANAGPGCHPFGAEPVPVSGIAGIPDAAQFEALEAAAKALLDACYLADANEELSGHVDGSLLDAMSDALEWRYPVIWTQEQVDALNASQGGYGHPFTCGGERGDEAHTAYAEENGEDKGQLIATKRGWVCPVCDYRQFWAHDHQFKGARENPLDFLRRRAAQGGVTEGGDCAAGSGSEASSTRSPSGDAPETPEQPS